MISGYYMGELCRLLSIEIFREKITDLADKTILNECWKFTSEMVSEVLEFDSDYQALADHMQLTFNFIATLKEAAVFQSLCRLVTNRSADMAATCLTAVFERIGIFVTNRKDERDPSEEDRFVFCEEYARDSTKTITVGVDGSVYKKTPHYAQRMQDTIANILTPEIGSRVMLVHSEDGSGKGAALAVAAITDSN